MNNLREGGVERVDTQQREPVSKNGVNIGTSTRGKGVRWYTGLDNQQGHKHTCGRLHNSERGEDQIWSAQAS